MLILGRNEGEDVIINSDLIIKVCHVAPNAKTVRLGFEGSIKDYVIDRLEVHKRKFTCICKMCGAPR